MRYQNIREFIKNTIFSKFFLRFYNLLKKKNCENTNFLENITKIRFATRCKKMKFQLIGPARVASMVAFFFAK